MVPDWLLDQQEYDDFIEDDHDLYDFPPILNPFVSLNGRVLTEEDLDDEGNVIGVNHYA